jgi:hypothetical protein
MTSALPRLLEEAVEFEKALPGLVAGIAAGAGIAAENYVEVVPQWWGLVFVLSDQAAKDLSSGSGGVAAVAGAIAAACAAIPGINIAVGIVAAILGLHSVVIGAMNRGQGVYVTAIWTVILLPPLWIPTPRT